MQSSIKPTGDSQYYQMVTQEDSRLTQFLEGEETSVDWTEVDWTGAKQDTRYFTHGIHPYPARMPPHISRRLLRMYAKSPNVSVLDPYCGSGGVLLESMLYDRPSVGVDLNPLAILIAKVKNTLVSPSKLNKARANLITSIEDRLKNDEPIETPNIRNVEFWFKAHAIKHLSIIRDEIDKLRSDKHVFEFFQACFSLTVRKSSNLRNGAFKLHGKQGEELKRFQPKAVENFSSITLYNISGIRSLWEEMENHKRTFQPKVLKGDTRKLLDIDPSSISENKFRLVVTSPPYGDSHTTVAYGQFSRYSSLWLGLPEDEVLTVDEKGLGGRILKKEANLESPTLGSTLSRIGQVDERRSREVSSFFYDADICLEQIAKSMVKGESHCCYVVANRTVRRVKVPTDIIFIELGKKHGLEHLHTIKRFIPNKYMSHVNAPENIPGKIGSTMTEESIVIWKY